MPYEVYLKRLAEKDLVGLPPEAHRKIDHHAKNAICPSERSEESPILRFFGRFAPSE